MAAVKVSEVLKRAREAFDKHDFDKCTEFLDAIGDDRAARLEPPARAHYQEMRGDIALDENEYDSAAESFEALIAAEGEAGESPVGLAFSYSRLTKALVGAEEYDRAHQAFQESLRLLEAGNATPNDRVSIWFGYGHALWEAERHQTAISALQETLKFAIAADQDPRAIAGTAYFLASSWSHVVQVQALARAAADMFAQAEEEEGIPLPDEAGDIADAGRDLETSLEQGEAAAQTALEWLTRAGEQDSLLARACKDYAEILTAGGKHTQAADAYRRALAHSKEENFSDDWMAALRESLGDALAAAGDHTGAVAAFKEAISIREKAELEERAELFRKLGTSLQETGDAEESQAYLERADSLEADDDSASESDEPNQEPLVKFPFDLSEIEIDQELYDLIDLDFSPSSYDYLEGYQLTSGTWWVCAFARNGIRELFGFRLIPGRPLAECPIVSVKENEAHVTTVCGSIRAFLPAKMIRTLYASWDDYQALDDSQWEQLVTLQRALGGTDDLTPIRDFLKNESNKRLLLEEENPLKSAIGHEPSGASSNGPWTTLQAATLLAEAAEEGRQPDAALIDAAWTIATSPAPLDMNETSLEPAQIFKGASILVRQGQPQLAGRVTAPVMDAILLTASVCAGADEGDYDGAAHFHGALELIKAKEYALAFYFLADLAYFSAVKVGESVPPALDAALALAELAGWEGIKGSLTYMKSLRDEDALSDEIREACETMSKRVREVFN